MQRHTFVLSTVILGLALAYGALADDDGHGRQGSGAAAFVGLWQGIDSFDGSTQLLSITCSRARACDVRLNDTAFTLSCQNQIGFAQGVGSIDRRVLTVDLTLYCSNLYGTSTLAGSQMNEFVLDRGNGTLTNVNDDPVPAPNVFHKISR
jgi:hypothetical protein